MNPKWSSATLVALLVAVPAAFSAQKVEKKLTVAKVGAVQKVTLDKNAYDGNAMRSGQQAGSAETGARCYKCHDEQVDSFPNIHHAKVWAARGEKLDCASCHGTSEDAHIKAENKETIIGFGKGSPAAVDAQNGQCLTCHESSKGLQFWKMGAHAKNDVTCSSCHSIHKTRQQMKPSAETCFACHKDIQMEVKKLSHHPIIEGKVSCSDCHNPHGSPTHGNLVAENVNQTCYKCHADKRGPFLWEHPPVEENCMSCHTAHGSSHQKLLTANVPNLCQNCHDASRHPGTPYSDTNNGWQLPGASPIFVARSCLNCHSKIHGSTAPAAPVSGATYGSGQYFVR